MSKQKHGEVRDGVLLVDEELVRDYADADKLRGTQCVAFELVNERKPHDAVSAYLRDQVLAPTVSHGTSDILAQAPLSTMPSVKRDRAKPSDAVSRAKLATTQLRVMDARKGRALQMSDKLRAEIAELDEKRNQFILTLDDKVIAILKAGGVL